jgi:formylglycine-generating enzyme required for sulfatase activity
MKRFVVFALVVACAVVSVRAAEKKIAILDIIDNAGTASDPVKACIHEAIRDRIAQFREFELCDISGIKEASHGITRSTRIEPYQAASLYEAYKVNHVVIVSLSYRAASNVVLYATLVELPSGTTINTATMTSATAILPLIEASQDLATKLLLPYKYTETAGGVNMQMVLVGEGSFQMGIDLFSTAEEPLQYNVTLDDYYIGATEVTQAQWRAVMGNNPSHFRGDNLPVDSVTWEEAQLFCQKLSELSGRLYTLPTEAQWEYAARGGAQTTYSGSNNIEEVAWFERNSGRRPHPVGLKMPNALGLYDMSGNIWEWCSDWFGPYTGGEHINPKGLQSGTERVLRGGSWIIEAEYCGITYRNANAPTSRDYNYGFRVVCLP